MKEAIVGCLVGFSVGKFGMPDKGPPIGMSRLTPNCRECRVSSRRDLQRSGNTTLFESNWFARSECFWPKRWRSVLIRTGLNDASNRR